MALPSIDLATWYERAAMLPMGTRALDRLLWRVVPFNRSIKPRLTALSPDEVRVEADLRKDLTNHLGSMHAAVLVSIGEYVQGLVIVANSGELGAELILKELHIDYVAKGRSTVVASCRMTDAIRTTVRSGLAAGDNVEVVMTSAITGREDREPVANLRGTWLARRPRR